MVWALHGGARLKVQLSRPLLQVEAASEDWSIFVPMIDVSFHASTFIRRLSQRHVDCPLTIMVPMDNTVYVTEIMNIALNASGQPDNKPPMPDTAEADQWKPVVLLMPARYGLEKITERYVNNLKTLFKLPQFLGIAGGRPGRSLYFVACQGNCWLVMVCYGEMTCAKITNIHAARFHY